MFTFTFAYCGKGSWWHDCLFPQRTQAVWEADVLLLQQILCCQTGLGLVPENLNPNLISGRASRIKYASLALICCVKPSKGQWMTAKLIISSSKWRSVSATSALLGLACLFMHNFLLIQRSQKLIERPSCHSDWLLLQILKQFVSLLVQFEFWQCFWTAGVLGHLRTWLYPS